MTFLDTLSTYINHINVIMKFKPPKGTSKNEIGHTAKVENLQPFVKENMGVLRVKLGLK